MNNQITDHATARASFEARVAEIRPKLHRYCARMIGSAIDAEDVVQDALANAFFNWPEGGVDNPEGWLFRIAHNRAIDYLRRARRINLEPLDEIPPERETTPPLENQEMAAFALSIFLKLTPIQRGAVILKDVLGYSISEISEMLDLSVGAVKAALHRARENLRKLAANDGEEAAAAREPTTAANRGRLADYISRFANHDFEGIRTQLIDDVSLDLVSRIKQKGPKEVGRYYSNYERVEILAAEAVLIEGHLAMLVTDADGPYPVLISWRDDGIAAIRDFRYARYVMDSLSIVRGE